MEVAVLSRTWQKVSALHLSLLRCVPYLQSDCNCIRTPGYMLHFLLR
jgi:hypothetical protein